MESLGYFTAGYDSVAEADTVPRSDGKVLVFKNLFLACICHPCHDFLVEVLDKYKVQIHQLTPNVVVTLRKFVWAMTTFAEGPFTEVFTKHYCLHW